MFLESLSRLVEEAVTSGVSEAHVFLLFSKLLTGKAERHLRSIPIDALSDSVAYLSKVFNRILRT